MKTLLSLILVVATAFGADTGSWQNLAGLEAGQRIEVVTTAGSAKGDYVRHDANQITIREKNGERAFPQADVTRVSIPKKSRGIWLGAVIGGVAGVAAGSAVGARLSNESSGGFSGSKAGVAAVTAAAGAAIGAGIGAAFRRATVVYRRP